MNELITDRIKRKRKKLKKKNGKKNIKKWITDKTGERGRELNPAW